MDGSSTSSWWAVGVPIIFLRVTDLCCGGSKCQDPGYIRMCLEKRSPHGDLGPWILKKHLLIVIETPPIVIEKASIVIKMTMIVRKHQSADTKGVSTCTTTVGFHPLR